MSKCQKNKYFNVGCQPTKSENKEFQQSFAKMMAAREAQDCSLQPSEKPEKSVTNNKSQILVVKTTISKNSDIDLILNGDI